MAEEPIILWFRRDLRLTDRAAVTAAVASGQPIVPVFVLDEGLDGLRPLGGASDWWLDKSLRALGGELERRGSRLIVRRGASTEVLPALAREVGASAAVWGRSYDPGGLARDAAVRRALEAQRVTVTETCGSFLVEPGTVLNGSGVTAAVLLLALARLGRTDAALYDGSWAEWGGRADTPVVTGGAR